MKVLPDKDNHKLGDTHYCIAASYLRQQKYHKVIFHSKKALKIRTQLGDQEGIADILDYIGIACTFEGNFNEAERNIKESYKIYTSLFGENHLKVANSYHSMGRNSAKNGKLGEAEEWYQKSLNIFIYSHGSNDYTVAMTLNKIACLQRDRGFNDKALENYKKCSDIFDHLRARGKLSERNKYDFAQTLYDIAIIKSIRNKNDEAEKSYKKSLDIENEISGENNFSIILTLNSLGILNLQKGYYSEAKGYFEAALKIQKNYPADREPTLGELKENSAKTTIMEQLKIKPDFKVIPV